MENATRALLIAAGVLVGVLILSLAVYLYFSLSDYIYTAQEEMNVNALSKFNNQFLKYTYDDNITIQEIITAANIAYENNVKYNLTLADAENTNSSYVKVTAKLYKEDGTYKTFSNLENIVSEQANDLLEIYKANSKVHKYKCTTSDIKISEETGRVYEINFK